jgi:phage-related protein
MMSESEIKASLEKMDADTKRQESEAAQLQKNEAEMKKFYATLLTAITPIISGLTTVLSTLTSVASFLITPFVKLAGWIIDIGADINSFFGKIYATTAGSLIKSFQELKEKFLKAVDPILAPITKLFSTGSGIFGKYFDVIAKVTSTLLSLPLTLVFKGLGLLVDALSITFELIGGAVEVVLDPLQSFADFLSDGLDALGSFVDYIASWDWIPESSETLKNSFDSVAYFVKDIVSSSFNFLKSAVGDVAEAFRSVGSVIKDVVMVPFNLLGSVINGISNTFKFFGELLSEITDPMKTLADTIASMISSVSSIGSGISSALSSINPSNWFGGGNKTPKLENEGTSGSPKTPKMADGGIVSKATNVIAGEAGPEAIVPLSQMGTIIQNFKMPEIISNTLNAAKSSDSKTQSDESNGAALEVITGSLDQLNNSIQEMLSYMRNIADNTENTHKATKSLNGNLWA